MLPDLAIKILIAEDIFLGLVLCIMIGYAIIDSIKEKKGKKK